MITHRPIPTIGAAVVAGSLLLAPGALADSSTAPPDTGMVLRGDEEGTVLQSLTVEGEDRVRITFDRPPLALHLDPTRLSGLDWDATDAILAKTSIDPMKDLLAGTAHEKTEYLARPWLNSFATGAVARFRPQVEGVEEWRLTVANSRGETVTSFSGEGKPPKELLWTGITLNGELASPGLTYSHVLEAYDRAGNKRNFVGDAFVLQPYIYENADSMVVLLPADRARPETSGSGTISSAPPSLLLEAASRLNQVARPGAPIRVEVITRRFEDARTISESVMGYMEPLLLGDPVRIQVVTRVHPQALDVGTIVFTARK